MKTFFGAAFSGTRRGLGNGVLRGVACLFLSLPAFSQQAYHTNDLTPPLALAGKLNGSSGGKQVGSGSGGIGTLSHAYLFTGNAVTGVDLNPAGYYSQATAISDDGSQQCGYGWGNGTGVRSLLWSGSSSSVVDLGP